jgi:hypothetical protein
MNVYSCWYRGAFGFTARIGSRRWLFVPDLGQPGTIRRNLDLRDLRFTNPAARRFEMERDAVPPLRHLLSGLQSLFGLTEPATAIGALLYVSA